MMEFWRKCLIVLLLVFFSSSVVGSLGCLRQRWRAADESFRDSPAIPRQNFGREAEQRGQAGLDNRSREIESSLGIEGEPPRFFDR